MSDPDLHSELLRYEAALAARDPAGVEGGLMRLIADDFMEFGRSGRTWTRDTIRELLEAHPGAPVPIEEFDLTRLADDVALVTYRTAAAK